MDTNTKLNDLIFKALDHAVDSVSGGEALVPFVLTHSEIHRFAADTFEQGKKEAENYIDVQKNEPTMVLAYDGFLTVDGEKFDAVFASGIDRTTRERIVLAQRYKPAQDGQSFTTIGNAALVSKETI